MKKILFICSILLTACGEDSSVPQLKPQPTKNIDKKALAAKSSGACDHAYIVGTWDATFGMRYQITKDCLIESFTCGEVGYIDSDVNQQQAGIATVVWADTYNGVKAGCPALGTYRCSFDTRGSTGFLAFQCQ